MENKESYLEFVSSESYKHQLDIWYRAYNISHEKTQLFYDFLASLHDLIEETFLGEDVVKTETEQHSHFTWCWNKTIKNFEKEKIYFKESGQHMEYFWNFFLEAYYFVYLDGEKVKIKIPNSGKVISKKEYEKYEKKMQKQMEDNDGAFMIREIKN